jgi:hypothetical protein
MPTTLAFKPIIDLPEWRPVANAPAASGAGTQLVAGLRNNSDRGAYVFLLASNTGLHAYDVEDDDWFTLGSPALAGTFGAGAGAVMMPSQGPRGTLAAGSTSSSVVLNTALPASVAPNQLANKGNSNGHKIRIIGNSAGGSGKTEERYIIGNTGGTTPTLYLDSPLSFTPATGDAYEILSGRLFLLGAGTLAAGVWKYYDLATNSFSGNLATTNLPATISTDSSFIGLDESYVPSDANPGDGYFGQLTATAATASTITGQAASGDAAVLANEYRNFQIRIVQDTTTPTAVGQRRNIASHTAGPSAVYTVSSNWTVTPSANSVFVIENNGDRILLWSSASANTFTYNITANAWDTTTFGARPAAMGAGCVSCPSFFLRPDTAKQSRNSYIFSFRGGNVATLDLFDIAGGATGLWTGAIAYGGSGGVLLKTGTTITPDPYTGNGRFAFINYNGGQRCLKFDAKNRVLSPAFYMRYPQGTAAVGQRMATAMFVDGSTKLVFILLQRMGGAEVFEMAVQK